MSDRLPPPAPGSRPAGRPGPLAWALLASLAVHGLLLAVRFAPPEAPLSAPADSSLEVVLLNATDGTEPLQPTALAQVSMSGGGERDEKRAASPLAARAFAQDGDALLPRVVPAGAAADAQDAAPDAPGAASDTQRAADAADTSIMTGTASASGTGSTSGTSGSPDTSGTSGTWGTAGVTAAPRTETADARREIARLQARIARDIEDRNRGPRRLTYGINAVGVPFARYVDAWAARVERIGTERYPPAARGHLYGSLVVLAEIDRHGNVVDVQVRRKSPHEALNRAAREIVLAGQPYERFSAEMAGQGDVLQIVRTWHFTNGMLETEGAGR